MLCVPEGVSLYFMMHHRLLTCLSNQGMNLDWDLTYIVDGRRSPSCLESSDLKETR